MLIPSILRRPIACFLDQIRRVIHGDCCFVRPAPKTTDTDTETCSPWLSINKISYYIISKLFSCGPEIDSSRQTDRQTARPTAWIIPPSTWPAFCLLRVSSSTPSLSVFLLYIFHPIRMYPLYTYMVIQVMQQVNVSKSSPTDTKPNHRNWMWMNDLVGGCWLVVLP